jgi:hypothetical protein
MNFDPEDLTLDEVEEVEEFLGASIDSVLTGDRPKGRALKAIVWVAAKRTNPDITLEEVGKLKLSELNLGEG